MASKKKKQKRTRHSLVSGTRSEFADRGKNFQAGMYSSKPMSTQKYTQRKSG